MTLFIRLVVMGTNMDLAGVWERFSRELHAHLQRKVPPQDADDVLQEVFLALLRNPPPAGVALPPWLWRLVRNHIAEYYRRRPDATAPLSAEVAQQETFEVREAEAVVASWLYGFAEFLEPKYRKPLLMADFEGASMKAIAAELGLSLSGAKSRVQRARKQLARDLQQCCAFHFDREGRVAGWQPRWISEEDACCN